MVINHILARPKDLVIPITWDVDEKREQDKYWIQPGKYRTGTNRM